LPAFVSWRDKLNQPGGEQTVSILDCYDPGARGRCRHPRPTQVLRPRMCGLPLLSVENDPRLPVPLLWHTGSASGSSTGWKLIVPQKKGGAAVELSTAGASARKKNPGGRTRREKSGTEKIGPNNRNSIPEVKEGAAWPPRTLA